MAIGHSLTQVRLYQGLLHAKFCLFTIINKTKIITIINKITFAKQRNAGLVSYVKLNIR